MCVPGNGGKKSLCPLSPWIFFSLFYTYFSFKRCFYDKLTGIEEEREELGLNWGGMWTFFKQPDQAIWKYKNANVSSGNCTWIAKFHIVQRKAHKRLLDKIELDMCIKDWVIYIKKLGRDIQGTGSNKRKFKRI